MPHKYRYDRSKCEGFFICVTAAPDDWIESAQDPRLADLTGGTQKEDGIWEKEIPDEALDAAITAAEGCPAHVIQVVDEEGNVVAGPDALESEQATH